MSPARLILASLLHHWRIHAAVAFGVAAGTAVLTGALLVGDSMRGSLRKLALERLGRVDVVLAPGEFFRVELADELAAKSEFAEPFSAAVPAILLAGTLENPGQDPPRRANQINLIAADRRFWQLGSTSLDVSPDARQIVLNRSLAKDLGVAEGDAVMLRLPRLGAIPAESPLGRKTETVDGHRLTVSRVIAAEGLGRFGLNPTQHLPRNAFVPLDWLAERLDVPGQANVILVAGAEADRLPSPQAEAMLQRLLEPTLDDYGIRVEKTDRGYFNVTSKRMLLEPAAEAGILSALKDLDVQPVLTYLANTITVGDRQIPYSTVTAVDFRGEPPLGPIVDAEGRPIGPLADGRIVLNRWAADQLGAIVGQTVRLTYFEPESTDGAVREETADFQLAAVAELSAAADDPAFTPEVAGVTDQLSMADWNPPFPFDAGRIRDEDEAYWDEHRATPKAFVSLATGRRLWSSRFGRTTSIRVAPEPGMTAESLAQRIRPDAAAMGFVFQPVKRQALAASKGTTAFEGYFLGFSFFIIAAAVMLVALLFRLGVDGRASQVGILLAVGLRRGQIARLLAAEGVLVAAAASVLGVAGGVGYAALMLAGLQTWWLDAIVTPFLELFVSVPRLAIGYFGGVAVALAAVVWSVWRTGRMSVRALLSGEVGEPSPLAPPRRNLGGWIAWSMLLAAVALGLAASGLAEEARAGAFFGAGALVLAALLMLLAGRLRRGATGPAVAAGRANLARLAVRNAARNPGRSTLTVGLVASAAFLIVSVSAFQVDPSTRGPDKTSGNGGFSLWAESTQPVYQDFGSSSGRRDLGFSQEDSRLLERATVYSLRMKPGEDASCLNLYRPTQPTVLGVPQAFVARGGFAFAASLAKTDAERGNPWLLLNRDLGTGDQDGPLVPAILDAATAKYSLHLELGDHLAIDDGRGHRATLVFAGLLKTSIFQGNLLVSEENLLAHFPQTSGFRVFLVESPPEQTDELKQALDRTLGDFGLAAETTGRRLANFLVVQNTYLSTFQTLGGLGLILGTFGLAAVELRNVLERRGELGLMRATGFRRRTLAGLVMLENGLLLAAGLGCGLAAAAVAVLPHFWAGGAGVPWRWLLGTLVAVLAAGTLAGLAAVRAALAAPLLEALRNE